MRVRHRVPSIFNLSMVDVLCCALGCVILLWLLNLRQAKEHEDNASETERSGAAQLDDAYTLMAGLQSRLDEVERDRAQLAQRRREQALTLEDLDKKMRATSSQLALLQAENSKLKTTAGQVPELQEELDDARNKISTGLAAQAVRDKEIAKRKLELAEATRALLQAQTAQLALEQKMATREKELSALQPLKGKLATTSERAEVLNKLLGEREQLLSRAKRQLELLEEDKKALRAEAARYRQAADNRFAGIELTGRRVIFLVDMSGSMDLVDEDTPSPSKWVEVRTTLAKIMRSLPDLSKYQVIVFSDKASFLLGKDGSWLDYDAKTSPDQVLTALAATRPRGGTDMYAALDAAFRYRDHDLDTIYLLSDGLPNLGEGLTRQEAEKLKEVERSDVLAKYIRKKLKTTWNRPTSNGHRVRINAVGFFYESPDVGAFLWAMARENDGSFVGMSRP